jgi:hypothetical protein
MNKPNLDTKLKMTAKDNDMVMTTASMAINTTITRLNFALYPRFCS